MFETFGQRLEYCRSLLGLSRPKLVSQLGGINKETIARWERNEVTIPIAQLERLESFYKNSGIQIDRNWLLSGKGKPPINNNLNRIQDLNYDDVCYLSFVGLKQNLPITELYLVNTDFYAPFVNFSEYITGFEVEMSSEYTNQLCYTADKNGLTVGVFNYSVGCLTNMHNQQYKIHTTDLGFKFGKVLTVSKKF